MRLKYPHWLALKVKECFRMKSFTLAQLDWSLIHTLHSSLHTFRDPVKLWRTIERAKGFPISILPRVIP